MSSLYSPVSTLPARLLAPSTQGPHLSFLAFISNPLIVLSWYVEFQYLLLNKNAKNLPRCKPPKAKGMLLHGYWKSLLILPFSRLHTLGAHAQTGGEAHGPMSIRSDINNGTGAGVRHKRCAPRSYHHADIHESGYQSFNNIYFDLTLCLA